MNDNEIQELFDLAENLKKTVTKEDARKSLIAAGILDEDLKYTEPYLSLGE